MISGPPELPLLSAASVWISVIVRSLTSRSRLIAETMPLVIVPRSCAPSGSPMATTRSPTASLPESPNSAGCKSVASTFSTARSLASSLPMIDAWNCRSSLVWTAMTCAFSMTWWFVIR